MMRADCNFCRCAVLFVLLLVSGCGRHSSTTSGSDAADAIRRVTEKGPVRLTILVSPPEPRLSDLVELDIIVEASDEVEIKAPSFGNSVGDFLVRDYQETTNGRSSEAEGHQRTFRYQLEPVHSGTHLIRSIVIEFIDHRESSEQKGEVASIASDPIEIPVSTMLENQVPDLAQLDEMLPPQPLQENHRYWLVGGVAVSILALLAMIRLLCRRKTVGEPVVVRTPEEVAREALARLLSEDLPRQALFKEFYVRLTGIVRVFIEGTTGLRAPEQTTEEFLREIRARGTFPADRSVQLQEFLEAADMVKYAGQQPGVEQIDLSIRRAQEFIGVNS